MAAAILLLLLMPSCSLVAAVAALDAMAGALLLLMLMPGCSPTATVADFKQAAVHPKWDCCPHVHGNLKLCGTQGCFLNGAATLALR